MLPFLVPALSQQKDSCGKMRLWMLVVRSMNTPGSSTTRESKSAQGRVSLSGSLPLTSPGFSKCSSSFEHFLLFAGVPLLSIARRISKIVPASHRIFPLSFFQSTPGLNLFSMDLDTGNCLSFTTASCFPQGLS